MLTRFIKATVVFSCGIYFFLIAYTNIVDFETNFVFVKHVLSMDTTFQSPHLMGRAITDVKIQKMLYQFMIGIEGLIAGCCLISALLLARSLNNKKIFEHAKAAALFSLFLGFSYFFVGFLIIAGEWFCMWQSHTASAQTVAALFSILMLLALLFVSQQEPDSNG